MKRRVFLLALAVAASTVHAEDGLALGIGADYSSGKYGSDTTTTIASIPFNAKYGAGAWTFKASLPWTRVDGDPNVVPGLGSVLNINPRGRGRGGTLDPQQPIPAGTASSIGDLRLSATYTLDTAAPLGIDLTAHATIATADEDNGLGTGANDYGVAVDLYRDFNGTLVFGGAGYTRLGHSGFIDVDSVFNANFGGAWKVRNASVGAMYDWREAATVGSDDRSELTGFVTVPAGSAGKVQFYAVKGLSDGSPDWGTGVNFSAGF